MATKQRVPSPELGTKQDGIDYIDRPGVYAIIENNERQIAVIETRNGYFLPGGGIDTGESNVDALKREILEEIGYQASVLTEIGETVEYIGAYSDEKHYQIHSRFYKVQPGSKVREGVEKDHRLVWLWQEDAVKLLKRQGQVWIVQNMLKGYMKRYRVHNYTTDELQAALRPIASLISKSEKAQQKLAPETWQHAMLRDNLKALHIASALMNKETDNPARFTRDDLQEALRAFASMISKTDKAQAEFTPGTSQHTLLANRLKALQIAETLIEAEFAKG